MWKMILVVLISVVITGCDNKITEKSFDNPENNHNFANPIKAGTLPDGRNVYMVQVAPDGKRDMTVFFTEDGTSTTTIETYKKGKKTYTETQVFLHGTYHNKCELASNCKQE